jgi:hypothetical protein
VRSRDLASVPLALERRQLIAEATGKTATIDVGDQAVALVDVA